jgi:hypothetical protein
MVMREVEGERLWCRICDSAANCRWSAHDEHKNDKVCEG